MTKFETYGCTYQSEAPTKEWAIRAFKNSCYICCSRGMRIECDRCAISETHKTVLAAFDSKDYERTGENT